MKKFLAVATASLMIAGFTMNAASAKHHRTHHRMHAMGSAKSLPGNNDELKGNNGNSAGGSNSLANTNNPGGGMGNNAGPPMR